MCPLLLLSAGIDDYVSLTNGSVTFSEQSDDLPAILIRLRDDSEPERTEQLLIHLMIPPLLQFGLVLETNTATIIILDDDSEIIKPCIMCPFSKSRTL